MNRRHLLSLLAWEGLPLLLPGLLLIFLFLVNPAYMGPLFQEKYVVKFLPLFLLITYFNIRLLHSSRPASDDRHFFPIRIRPYTFKRIFYFLNAVVFVSITLFVLLLLPAGIKFFDPGY